MSVKVMQKRSLPYLAVTYTPAAIADNVNPLVEGGKIQGCALPENSKIKSRKKNMENEEYLRPHSIFLTLWFQISRVTQYTQCPGAEEFTNVMSTRNANGQSLYVCVCKTDGRIKKHGKDGGFGIE